MVEAAVSEHDPHYRRGEAASTYPCTGGCRPDYCRVAHIIDAVCRKRHPPRDPDAINERWWNHQPYIDAGYTTMHIWWMWPTDLLGYDPFSN